MSRSRSEYNFPRELREERKAGVGYCCEVCGKKINNNGETHHLVGAWLSAQNPVLTPAIIKSLENELYVCKDCHNKQNEDQHNWDAHDIAMISWALFDLDPDEVEQAQRRTYKDLDANSGYERKPRTKANRKQRRKRRKRRRY